MNDISRRRSERVGVVGVTPGFIDTLEPMYVSYT